MKARNILLLTVAVALFSCNTKIENGEEVIRLMKEKYNNSYLQNFTFSQHIKEYQDDSIINKTIWHEAYSCPNNLIIKMDSFNSGSGYIFNEDTLYIMNNNVIDSKFKETNILMLLGFDVYSQSIQNTTSKLIELNYDVTKVCETQLNGRNVFCVGAENETDSLNKFYIDKETLCFLKYTKYSDNGIIEGEFTDYKMVEDKYIATKVLFYLNKQIIMTEEYYNIHFPDTLDSKIFDYRDFENSIW